MLKRLTALLCCLALLLPVAASAEDSWPLSIRPCHQVKLNKLEITQDNQSVVAQWTVKTAQPEVDREINGLVRAYADELRGRLKQGGQNNENSRLNVSVRYSRTGLTWMSFLVQARTIYHLQTEAVSSVTRTYDMTTGERVYLTDIFPADSPAWALLAQAVRDGVNAYYPALTADAEKLEKLVARESLENLDFTLHGMSLVLHVPAEEFYPGHPQLLEITLYYPDIRPYMTERAQTETDNLSYYKTAALTFDDGPFGWVTDRMLQMLMAHGTRATFFVVGERLSTQVWLVQREHDEGHTVATHNWKHVYANTTPISTLQPMPERVNAAHIKYIGIAPAFARAPGGHWQGMAAAELNWPLIQWTVDATDWAGDDEGPDPHHTAGNIFAGTDDGGIILMHDMKINSVTAMDELIPRLESAGFLLLTVDELFAKDGVTLQPNTPYWRCTNGQTTR